MYIKDTVTFLDNIKTDGGREEDDAPANTVDLPKALKKKKKIVKTYIWWTWADQPTRKGIQWGFTIWNFSEEKKESNENIQSI